VQLFNEIACTVARWLEMPLGKGAGALLGAYIVYWLGLRTYFRQKEYEHVRERYLEQGFDIAIAQIDYALAVYRSNWALFLRHVKLCRDTTGPFHADAFFETFKEVDQSRFQLTPIHRLGKLLEVEALWALYQSVFSFVGTKNDEINADFGAALRALERDPVGYDKAKMVAEAESMARQMNEESHKHYLFLSELQTLAHLFERKRYSRRSLKKFAKRKDVGEILDTMRARLKPEVT
jgi:hypothetical protein